MIPINEIRSAVPATLADLRDVPLADMPPLSESLLGSVIERAMLGSSVRPRPVAGFQSAI
jgi:FXSXX-COOH protein